MNTQQEITYTERCPNCGSMMQNLDTFGEFRTMYDSDSGVLLKRETSCDNCNYRANDKTASKLERSEILKKILQSANDFDLYRKGEFKRDKTIRMFALGNLVESVQQDMIKDLYLKNSAHDVPESYLFAIRCEHPKLCTTDFIQHIWDLQNTGADVSKGEAKLIVYNSRRFIKGVWQNVLCGSTSYHWSFFMKMISQEKDFDGYKIVTGLGDRYNVYSEKMTQDLYAECSVKRKNLSVAIKFRAFLGEYCKKNSSGNFSKRWENAESMLSNIALINALKHAFPSVKNINVDYDTMEETNE